MKKYNSLVEAFTDTNKEIIKTSPMMEPGDVYLAYCAIALCTIADKMTVGNSLERKNRQALRHSEDTGGDEEVNAYKCDICGKYFENSRVKTGSPWRAEEEVDGRHKFTIGVVNSPEKFLLFDGDICPDCMGYFCVGLCERGCRDEKIKMYAADYIRKVREEKEAADGPTE